MDNAYNNSKIAAQYQAFLASKDGQTLKKITGEAILKRAPSSSAVILDAGCGTGWLSGQMARAGHKIFGIDGSEELLASAKKNYPQIDFKFGNLEVPLPYSPNEFNIVILNMAIHSLENEKTAIENLKAALKPQGKIIVTIPNPYYAFPVAVWKRGIYGYLLQKKPKLKFNNEYTRLAKQIDSSYVWNGVPKIKFYPLSEHLNNFIQAGFSLSYFEELNTDSDSPEFNLNYQLYRYPLILLLEFTKTQI